MRCRRTAVLGLILVLLGADEPRIVSGYQPGEFIRPCPVQDVTGPHAGKAICYKCVYSPKPVVCIVTTSIDEPLAKLTKALDDAIAKDARLNAYVIVPTDDFPASAKALKDLADRHTIARVPLTMQQNEGLCQSFKIDPKALYTIMIWKNSTGKVNRVFGKDELTETAIRTIVETARKVAAE